MGKGDIDPAARERIRREVMEAAKRQAEQIHRQKEEARRRAVEDARRRNEKKN